MVDTAVPKAPWVGRNVTIQLILDERELNIPKVDLEITALGEEIEDDFCGDDRSEFDFELKGYGVTCNAKQRGLEAIEAFIRVQSGRDAKTLRKQSALGFVIKPNDGTKKGYELRQLTLGAWSIRIGGRTQRNGVGLPFKARYFEPISL